MRAHTPGGRFTTDFELNAIADGITADSTNPVGTTAQWWTYNSAASVKDPVYDVEPVGAGRVWTGPAILKVIKAIITQGRSDVNERGFYNVDSLRLVLNVDDLREVSPAIFDDRGVVKSTIDLSNKNRVVWKNQVYRPIKTQQQGQIAERHTIISLDLIQLMPDELVNDAQFLAYAQA